MQVGTGWTRNVQDGDKAKLLAVITSGNQEFNDKTGMMMEQYRGFTTELDEQELEKAIKYLARGNVYGQDIAANLTKELVDLRDPVKVEERRLALQTRQEQQAATEAALLKRGMDHLGGEGDTWDGHRDQIDAWWREVKAAEAAETWATAFSTNRMSARQVNSKSVLGGEFEIRNKRHLRDRAWDRKITLDRTLGGLRKRIVPANFNHPETGVNNKFKLGLHDLSASLLDGTRKPMAVRKQLKPYEDAIVVFMPVPTERHAQIFHAIQSLKPVTTADEKLLRTMRSSFTRLRLAQATDMHTYLVNVNDDEAGEPMVRYGHSGLIRRRDREVPVDEIDIATRRTNALQHNVILGTGVGEVVNEVVMVYREHASGLFPVFAKWNQLRSWFTVLDRNTEAPTMSRITDTGEWVS
jgi:hypothetical protein